VPISAGLLTDTGTYFDALNAFRGGDAGPIVHRFADASRFAAASGRILVDDLAAQLTDARDKLIEANAVVNHVGREAPPMRAR
jgi:hypothetical protein